MPETLRRAGPGDAATLAALNAPLQAWHAEHYPEVFRASPDPAQVTAWFAQALAEPEVTAFLIGTPPQGYVLLRLFDRPANPFSPAARRLMIEHVTVAPEARGQGLGRALMQAAFDHARALGAPEVMLDTWAGNTGAHAFFRRCGLAPRRMLFHRTL